MDFVIEFLMELYMSFAIVITEDKKMKRSTEIFLKIVCVIVSSSIFILLYSGISTTFGVFGNEVEFPLGIILLSVGCFLFLFQTTIVILTAYLKHRKQKRSDENDTE